jgi:hypothetical protein
MDGVDYVDSIREVLSGHTIHLVIMDDDTGIFDQVDAFVNLSRGNESVEQVVLHPFTDPGDDISGNSRYAIWEKVAEGISNLQALSDITIFYSYFVDDEENPLAPDWEILACILRRLQQGILLRMQDSNPPLLWDTETLPAFAGVIRGQAMITGFSTGDSFSFHCLDILCSALLTLPALENVSFDHIVGQGPEEGQSLQSMVQLLQSPSLRDVGFADVVFTNTLSQAVAKALKESSEIADLSFFGCSFPEGGSAVIASVLKTNTILKRLRFDSLADEVFYEVLAAALLSNSTLQNLTLHSPDSCSWLCPLFLALRVNEGLKKLNSCRITMDEKVSAAMRLGLLRNSTLESLNFFNIKSGDDDSCLWREALSFLRTNTALKALYMNFAYNVSESHASAIRMELPTALHENESLETLYLYSKDAGLEDYPGFIAAIQPNTTLKSLWLHSRLAQNSCEDGNEFKYLIAVLKKNYGLEEIPGLRHGAGDINSIFELNRAGRRYLVLDGSSISKGVDVLSGVSNNINSVFLHLLENPRLCDRSAVEMSNIGNMDNARSTSPGNHSGGKREQQAPSHTGNETRRRLE